MKILRSTSLLLLLGFGAWAQEPPKEIAITAKRFGFTPKQVTLKQGETVTLVLTSEDVTHGFFSRDLKVDAEIPTGKETRVTVTPQAAGSFPVICNRFCGSGHSGMKMTIVVE